MMQAIYHGLAALVMVSFASLHPAACGAVIGLMWLLRELAQHDSGNMLAAIASMPSWSIHKHMEWVVPFGIAVLAGFWI